MAFEPVRLNFLESVDLVLHRTPRLIVSALWTFLTTIASRKRLGWPLKRILAVALVRESSTTLTRRQLAARNLSTGDGVAAFAQAHAIKLASATVSCGSDCPDTYLHSLSLDSPAISRPAGRPKVFYYLHGGGFISPLAPKAQLPMTIELARAAGCEALVVLEYSLSPRAQYPVQHIQAAHGLAVLLKTYAPDDVVVAGDSAGGNLALGLLAHAKRPLADPRMPSLAHLLRAPLRAALLISPAVNTSTRAPSYAQWGSVDMLWASRMDFLVDQWGAPKDQRELHAEPILQRDGFWRDVPAMKTLLVAGGAEVFYDDIVDLAQLMGASAYDGKQKNEARIAFAVADSEVHVQAAVDCVLGLPSVSGGLMQAWIRDV